MNINRIHTRNPLTLLLSFFIWMGLEWLVWDVFSTEKVIDKYSHKGRIEKVIHILCSLLALPLSVFILAYIERLTGLDLPD